jgi:hypothetical protein
MMLADSPVVKRWLEPYKPFVIAVAILAVGLILGIVVIALPPAETQSAAVVAGNEGRVQRGLGAGAAIAERGADFFLDHELMYAGGYALRPAAAVGRGADFDFLDHELRVAGGYALVAAAERGTGFDFLDHELMYAGGYALRPAAGAERGADFDFLDHELRYAGSYALAATAEK